MAKKTTSFRLEPPVLKRLKLLAIEHECPIGDVIEGLLNFPSRLADRGIVDPALAMSELSGSILEVGSSGGLVHDPESENDAIRRARQKAKFQSELGDKK